MTGKEVLKSKPIDLLLKEHLHNFYQIMLQVHQLNWSLDEKHYADWHFVLEGQYDQIWRLVEEILNKLCADSEDSRNRLIKHLSKEAELRWNDNRRAEEKLKALISDYDEFYENLLQTTVELWDEDPPEKLNWLLRELQVLRSGLSDLEALTLPAEDKFSDWAAGEEGVDSILINKLRAELRNNDVYLH